MGVCKKKKRRSNLELRFMQPRNMTLDHHQYPATPKPPQPRNMAPPRSYHPNNSGQLEALGSKDLALYCAPNAISECLVTLGCDFLIWK